MVSTISEKTKVPLGLIGVIMAALGSLAVAGAGVIIWGTRLEAKVEVNANNDEIREKDLIDYRSKQREFNLRLQSDVQQILIKVSAIEQELKQLNKE